MVSRREFLVTSGLAAGSALGCRAETAPRTRFALVGTGYRGVNLWGRDLVRNYGDLVELVGLCDINPGRLAFAKGYIGVECPTFTDFDSMLDQTRPEKVIVTTVDATHHAFIIAAMKAGADVITEKPLTTDATRLQGILDAQNETRRNVTVTHNYRYAPHRQKMKELIQGGAIGRLTSADFHWYLDVYHGASYFRRWHGKKRFSGTLFVHKSCHHFDLLNWWIDSEPELVYAQGALEFYGRNNPFRSTRCRGCPHGEGCDFYWDIETEPHLVDLYVNNEHHDGYLRDACIWSEDIDIYDKMSAQIRYAGGVQVSYSCTTYSPYEGYRVAFNGTRGRLEAWIQERQPWPDRGYDELRLVTNFGAQELITVPHASGGHAGGDTRMQDHLFRDVDGSDPYRQRAGLREGAMAVLVGFAACKSVETGEPIQIASLSSLEPRERR